MLRLPVLLVPIALLLPLAGATPTVATDCAPPFADPSEPACGVEAADPEQGAWASCHDRRYDRDPYVETTCRAGSAGSDGAAGTSAGASCARNLTMLEPTKVEVPNLRAACGADLDGDGADDAGVAARNFTVDAQGPIIDLAVCCGGLDDDGEEVASLTLRNRTATVDAQGPSAMLAARNTTVPPGDPDFDLRVCCGDVDGDGEPDPSALVRCTPAKPGGRGEPGEPASCRWRIYAPLPSAGAAHVTCCPDDDGDGRGDLVLRVKGGPTGDASVVLPLA